MTAEIQSYRAAYVIPMDRPPIPNGTVSVSAGQIVSVGKHRSGHSARSVQDLGDVAIIPALVNAHSHLEFSQLLQPLGYPGIEFTAWIREVIQTRKTTNSTLSEKSVAIRQGLSESWSAGVGCIGEIATAPVDQDDYVLPPQPQGPLPIHLIVFNEQLGRSESQFEQKIADAKNFVSAKTNSRVTAGISPHAPYSVHSKLLAGLVKLAIEQRVPVAMHLAETSAERELLERRTGPFVELLADLGVWHAAAFLPPQNTLQVLQILAQAPRSLIVHGNYLNSAELEFIARQPSHMSIIYCPRTHQFFGHERYPLEKILAAKICLAIGTDSRASNPDLNLFTELQTVSQAYPGLSPLQVLEFGTLNGARALGVEPTYGSISPGKSAFLSLIRAASIGSKDWDGLLSSDATCEPIR